MFEQVDIPLSGNYSSALGWDSDAGSRDTGFSRQGTTGNEGESIVWQNSLNVNYGFKLKGRNSLGFGANYSNLFYFNPAPGVDQMDHNARVSLRYSRQVNRSLTVSNATYVSYETEPNYDIGLSVTRPTSGYFLGSNRLSANYQWNRRFSTVTGYSFSTILYEDQSLDNESYYRNSLTQDFRYAFKRRLSGTLSYRYNWTVYEDNDEGDSVTQSVLAGLDYQWNRRLSVSGKAGVDYRAYDGEQDSEVAPRVEVGLSYILAKRTSASWRNLLSLDDTGRAGSQTGYSYRSSFGLSHGFSRRLGGSLSLNYIHSDYGNSVDGLEDGVEDTIYTGLSLNYMLWRNISLNANYNYSFSTADGQEDYSRHRLFVGMSYAF